MDFVKVAAESLYELAALDYARNYFICYTLNNHQAYDSAYRLGDSDDPIIGVFVRKTGIVQIAVKPGYNPDKYKVELETLLSSITWKQINTSGKIAEVIKSMSFQKITYKGASISKCLPDRFKVENKQNELIFKRLTVDDLPEVVNLYKTVFKGFATYQYMKEKLDSGRGRALGGYYKGMLVTVAQTDYETSNSALIVGVATLPEFQKKGYGRTCLEILCKPLTEQEQSLYLQYDAPHAGKLYSDLGFEIIDNILQIKRKSNEV